MEKKINKDFILGDSTVNSYGFRMLTSGYMIEEFRKNPIGYYMHARDGEFDRQAGVLVRWDELRIEGDEIKAKPCINLEHARGQRTVNEVNNGFLNGASFGFIVVLEASEDESLKLAGQTGPTVTKWYNRECSIVDIPANKSSVILYNVDGKEINLSDFSNGSYTFLKADKKNTAKVQPLESVELQIIKAIDKNIITEEDGEKLKETFKNAPDRLQVALEFIDANRTEILAAKSYEELDIAGELEDYKQRDFEGFKQKFKEEFKKDYAGSVPKKPGDLKPVFVDVSKTQRLAAKSWEELDYAGELEEYKQRDLEGFKRKFHDQFGFHYNK